MKTDLCYMLDICLARRSYSSSTKKIDMKIFGSEGVVTYSGEDTSQDAAHCSIPLTSSCKGHASFIRGTESAAS